MVRVAAVKVNSFDYNYEDVERGMNEAIVLIGGMERFINPGEKVFEDEGTVVLSCEGIEKVL